MTDGASQSETVGGRILFVDDEENILRSLRRLFMDDAFEVFIANSGKEALRILDELEDALARRIGEERVKELREALEQDWGEPVDLEN